MVRKMMLVFLAVGLDGFAVEFKLMIATLALALITVFTAISLPYGLARQRKDLDMLEARGSCCE